MSSHSDNVKFLENLAYHSARWAGSPKAYLISVGFTLVWLASGPLTFIMVFLIQRSQDKNSLAMQIKLNEIIASLHGANNRMINIEDLSEGEIHSIQKDYQDLATHIHKDNETSTHAVSMDDVIKLDEAELAAQ